eukprot:3181863-Prymnesium_polylepis.1
MAGPVAVCCMAGTCDCVRLAHWRAWYRLWAKAIMRPVDRLHERRSHTTPRPQCCAACRSYGATPRLPLAACRPQALVRQRVGRREARTSDGLAVA